MIVTIQVENQRDFQWLLPFLEALKQNTSLKVEVKANGTERDWDEKLEDFFRFIEQRAVRVPKVERLTRDQLNER
ncbi:MAG: hypothetical protein JNJ90_01545 [Saprospiraceae bacterium]|jgi:hypothetical protein|nr:hypothetical protein [Saprospiraceae bacterium]